MGTVSQWEVSAFGVSSDVTSVLKGSTGDCGRATVTASGYGRFHSSHPPQRSCPGSQVPHPDPTNVHHSTDHDPYTFYRGGFPHEDKTPTTRMGPDSLLDSFSDPSTPHPCRIPDHTLGFGRSIDEKQR